jgi:hypothetical protein
MTVESPQFKKIALIVAIGAVLVATGVLVYVQCGTTGVLLTVGLVGFFFVFVFLPDAIATCRGVNLKIKGDVAGDEIGLPLVILAFPYRLSQALTSIPTKEVMGRQALGAEDGKQKTLLGDRRQRLRASLEKPLENKNEETSTENTEPGLDRNLPDETHQG